MRLDLDLLCFECRSDSIERGTNHCDQIDWSKVKLKFSGDKQPSAEELDKMHHGAHEQCFIANSVKTEVTVVK